MPSYGFYSSSSSPSSSPASPIHNNSFSSPSRPESKRKQVKNACTNCQKACKKCDDQRPCTRCVKYGIEDSCVNSQRKERKRKDSSYSASASESPSERSSPLPAMTRSGREIRHVQRQQEAVRSTNRSIRSFSKELLQSLQDEEDFCSTICHEDEEDQHQDKQQNREFFPSPQMTQEFKALVQLCSDLHVKIHQHQPVMNSYSYAPQLTPAYPIPSSYMYRALPPIHPVIEAAPVSSPAFFHIPFDHRNFMNRTPPEDLPSPVKSEDGNNFESSFKNF
jgi:hypothetical protein